MSLTADPLPEFVPQARSLPWGTAASVAVHTLFAAMLIAFWPLRPLDVPPPPAISVQLMSPAEVAELLAPPKAAPVLSAPKAPAAETVAPPANDGLTEATELYSAAILSDPANKRIKQGFESFADSERLVQLCDMEGLEQIHRTDPQFDPDTIVAYAMGDPLSSGLTLTANGAAFRSGRRWYNLRFRCTAKADLEGITAFAFAVGEAIPRDQWDAHDLNESDEEE